MMIADKEIVMSDRQFTMSMYSSMEELHIAKAKYYQAKYESALEVLRKVKERPKSAEAHRLVIQYLGGS